MPGVTCSGLHNSSHNYVTSGTFSITLHVKDIQHLAPKCWCRKQELKI